MRGRAFLNAARRLGAGVTEEDWRSAASRAYYALFLEAREVLRRWGFALAARDRAHRDVRLRFSYAADPDLQLIGDMLDRLSQVRNRADYELNPVPWFTTDLKAHEAIARSEHAIVLLDQIEADPSRRAGAIGAIRKAFP